MVIGVPREVKKEEYRVALTPSGVLELKAYGHRVVVEEDAGAGSGLPDRQFLEAGAEVAGREAVFREADLIVKVKEPLAREYGLFRPGQALFAFLHLAPNPGLLGVLLERHVSALAYETLEVDGRLPLLAPMSEIAGRMAPLMGAFYLQKQQRGCGVFPAGATGVEAARCVIIGAGVAGTNAARVAHNIGMDTVVLNRGMERLKRIDEMFAGRVKTVPLTDTSLLLYLRDADMVVCAVLVPGGKTPVLITRDRLRTMKKGAVVIDISVDQGGALETSRATTHQSPVYEVDGVIHYCVANMPGAYPRTATLALATATLPYVIALARDGIEGAVAKSRPLRTAMNTYRGSVVHPLLAASLGVSPADIDELMSTKPSF